MEMDLVGDIGVDDEDDLVALRHGGALDAALRGGVLDDDRDAVGLAVVVVVAGAVVVVMVVAASGAVPGREGVGRGRRVGRVAATAPRNEKGTRRKRGDGSEWAGTKVRAHLDDHAVTVADPLRRPRSSRLDYKSLRLRRFRPD